MMNHVNYCVIFYTCLDAKVIISTLILLKYAKFRVIEKYLYTPPPSKLSRIKVYKKIMEFHINKTFFSLYFP